VAVPKDKVARLEAAGVITAKRLPSEYRKVLNGMRDTDIDGLILLMKRLEAAEKRVKRGSGLKKLISECFVPL
jgi:hypothetical protein